MAESNIDDTNYEEEYSYAIGLLTSLWLRLISKIIWTMAESNLVRW